MKESASHHVNKSVSFILRGSASEKLISKRFWNSIQWVFIKNPIFQKNLKIIILIFAERFWIDTGSFGDCERKLEIQRKMYLKFVERSL